MHAPTSTDAPRERHHEHHHERHPERQPARRNGRSWFSRALVVAAGVTVLGLAPWLWVQALSRGHITDAANAPHVPVTLVLGAGLTASGTPTPYLAARLDVAIELHRSGRTQVILVSGDNRTHTYDEPTAMRDYLLARGIPLDDVVRDFAGRDTYDSCARAQRIFGVDRLLVVSQGYHLPRAVATCRALGLDAAGVGDWRMQQAFPQLWRSYALREVAASWKTVLDVVIGREPVLGEQETPVTDALRRHGIHA